MKENFWPHFTFHGFRYIRIKGFKGEIRIDSIDKKQRDVIDFEYRAKN